MERGDAMEPKTLEYKFHSCHLMILGISVSSVKVTAFFFRRWREKWKNHYISHSVTLQD